MSSLEYSSPVWYHFRKAEGNKAECRYCHKFIATSSGSTSNLRRHLKNKHPFISLDRAGTQHLIEKSSIEEELSEKTTNEKDSTNRMSVTGGEKPAEIHSNRILESSLPVATIKGSQDLMTSFIEVIKPLSAQKISKDRHSASQNNLLRLPAVFSGGRQGI